jgi:glycosyltransferase involved in cell wall biosynthesis
VRLLVASTFVPFIKGGGTAIVEDLRVALEERGHAVDTILLPFWPDHDEMLEQMLAFRLLDVSDAGDRLVTIRTPSYLLRHPHKIAWFIHHHRAAYDLWSTDWAEQDSAESLLVREAIIAADDVALRECTRIFTNSNVVSERLRRYNGLESTVLYPPLGDASGYRSDEYGDYVFYPSRITRIKRQELVVRAMRHTRSPARLVLAGSPDAPEHLERLEELVESLGMQQRVELIGSWISEERKRDLFAGALACAYVPYDEDSYGYVTLEAFESAKAVITCSDSGGTLDVVEDGVTGFVCEPEAEALAATIDRLYEDRELARRLGEQGRESIERLQISWDTVVESLTA